MLFSYAALNAYLLLKIRPLPICFIPRFANVDERELDRLAA
ncbi:MAG: hypothetical protein WD904_12480 [Dehalococcoidia bacterium]